MSEHARSADADPVYVDDVVVHPPVTQIQARLSAQAGLLADSRDGLLAAWQRIEDMWSVTTNRALELDEDALNTSVGGEWSFLETLRHLVFVTDGWVRRSVLGEDCPFHPLGVPPDFIDGADVGIEPLVERPSADDVFTARRDRMDEVRRVLAACSHDDLSSAVADGPWTKLGAFQCVIFEEWAHHRYATRDLIKLGI